MMARHISPMTHVHRGVTSFPFPITGAPPAPPAAGARGGSPGPPGPPVAEALGSSGRVLVCPPVAATRPEYGYASISSAELAVTRESIAGAYASGPGTRKFWR